MLGTLNNNQMHKVAVTIQAQVHTHVHEVVCSLIQMSTNINI